MFLRLFMTHWNISFKRWHVEHFRKLFCTIIFFFTVVFVEIFFGDIQKVRSLMIPEFWPPPPPPFFILVRFRGPPRPLKVRSFCFELTLSPSISIPVKFWEKKLIMSTSIFGWTERVFKKPQWNLYKMDTIGAWQKVSALWRCPIYRDI